jgi:glycosyltransferase involved in cell wall biosynthesis
MRVVIDAVPITGASTAIVTQHLLQAWAELETDDEIHVVVGPRGDFTTPSTLHVHRVSQGRFALLHRLWAQTVTLPLLCRRFKADILLGMIASTTIAPLPCPRSILVYDMRHEMRPEQFPRRTLLLRRISYRLGYRQSRAIACISESTKTNLLANHPHLSNKVVRVVHLGSDHVAAWPIPQPEKDYAIAFGQHTNKNVALVLRGWAELKAQEETLHLFVFGLPEGQREVAAALVSELGLSDQVTLLPWLSAEEFHKYFTSASLVVFPSDFEGFGLPAVEAMSLGIPLVISSDPALLEVTGGHAVIVPSETSHGLAQAVVEARQLTPGHLLDAKAHACQFTWAAAAARTRAMLQEALQGSPAETAVAVSELVGDPLAGADHER